MVGSYHRLKVSPIARSGSDSDGDSDGDHDNSSSTCNHVDDDSANMNLFHANHQISKEAMERYYSQNTFAFGGDYCGNCRIPKTNSMLPLNGEVGPLAAYAYLKDRSPTALSYIKHIEFHSLGDASYFDIGSRRYVYGLWYAVWEASPP